ncbi:hypothetical protein B0O80DRAFT_24068 [Mortierella sp. GBAus27b]|nr:hypothetical protein B0O80DRAFT_24068 [Mortierella sp. GBAus27b]
MRSWSEDKQAGEATRFWQDMEQKEAKERHLHALHLGVYERETAVTELHTRDILFDIGTGVVASSASASSSASPLEIIGAAGRKHPRDPSGELGEASPKIARNASPSVGLPSELLRTPLQSPTPSESASPVRSFILSEDKDEESLPTSVPIHHHGNDPDAFFTSPTEYRRRNVFCKHFMTESNFLVTLTVQITPSIFLLMGGTGGHE